MQRIASRLGRAAASLLALAGGLALAYLAARAWRPQAGPLNLAILATAAVVFTAAEGLLIYATWRMFRGGRGAPGHLATDLLWTAAPAGLLIVLLAFAARAALQPPAAPGPAIQVTAIGHQWWWEFRYPDLGVVTANEMVVPAGAPVRVSVQTADVAHAFWAPELLGQTDALPGLTAQAEFIAPAEGPVLFGGLCTQACGDRHTEMRFTIDARPPEAFAAWIAAQLEPAAAEGEVFLAQGCGECHTVRGTAAQGAAGPDLTHLMSRRYLAGGQLKNDAFTLRLWLLQPHAARPGTAMRLDDPLSEESAGVLVDYLLSLK